ncbi:MAG: phosphoribosyltransferase [Scytonema sp. PMC 1069.18]|nr:phosphoribosyltransferase [Scytonema sp. PMC 1069.18]MEC4883942.1 phosphoribosyltransferase [Scytonema sp. PMC 1070.18]
MRFKNRTAAGQFLAAELAKYANRRDVLVLALPRGGVPVAFEIAKALNLPLDVFVVRKLGVPDQRELAMGAIASGGVRVLNQDIVRSLRIPEQEIDKVAEKEQQELQRRQRIYRGDRPFPKLQEHTVILVDDGLATGATMRAAVTALQKYEPVKIAIAVPVAAPETCQEFENNVDEVVCGMKPNPFYSVGLWYDDFPQTADEEVHDLLEKAANREEKTAVGAS